MSDTTRVEAQRDTTQAARLPLPLMLLMLDMLQARGRTEAAASVVDEIYAGGDVKS